MTLIPGTVLLEAREVDFAYAHPIIRRLSLSLRSGVVTGIIGPNGSGKTTLLRLLDAILRPDIGDVLYRSDISISDWSRREVARRIAMVPQNGRTCYYQSVQHFAMTGRAPHLSLLGFESIRDEEIALEALALTHMTELKNRRVAEISGGEKQRLLLARALAQQSEILLLDEFTANLDINYQIELMRMVRDLTRERGLATLVVSHEVNLLANFVDHLVLLRGGAIIGQGATHDVATRENLNQLFGIDFVVRHPSDGGYEILPVVEKGKMK